MADDHARLVFGDEHDATVVREECFEVLTCLAVGPCRVGQGFVHDGVDGEQRTLEQDEVVEIAVLCSPDRDHGQHRTRRHRRQADEFEDSRTKRGEAMAAPDLSSAHGRPDRRVRRRRLLDRARGLEAGRVRALPDGPGAPSYLRGVYCVRRFRELHPRVLRAVPGSVRGVSPVAVPTALRDPADLLARQDLIYVGGGSTANLLAVWRVHGVDRLLADAADHGTILYGSSAGGICWFESGLTDSLSFDAELRPLTNALGMIGGSHAPHFDRADRREAYVEMVADGRLGNGVGIDDDAAVHYVDGEIRNVVATRSGASAHLVTASGRTGASVTPLDASLI